jgi:anti-anti-sigma factor
VGIAEGSALSGHVLLLHRSEGTRARELTAWVRQGLARGERIIYPLADGDGDRNSLLDMLSGPEAAGRQDVDAALADGRLRIASAAEYYPSGRQTTLVGEAFAEGYASVRMFGDADTAMRVLGEQGYLAFEREIDWLCAGGRVSILCTYDERLVPRELALRNVTLHPGGLKVDLLTFAAHAGEVHLSGELDRSNADLLEASLAFAAERERPGNGLRVVMSNLTFCDVAGARAVLQGSRFLGDSGGRVLLLDPVASVRRTFDLMRVDPFPGLAVWGDHD